MAYERKWKIGLSINRGSGDHRYVIDQEKLAQGSYGVNLYSGRIQRYIHQVQ